MDVPNSLKVQVQGLEGAVAAHVSQIARYAAERQRVQGQYVSICSNMGWREKYLAGRFGGDKTSVKRAKSLEDSINRLDRNIGEETDAAQKSEHAITTTIINHLEASDSQYQLLHLALQKITVVTDGASSYIKKIDEALAQIEDAEAMETADLFTKNKGISTLSWIENQEAEDAVCDVKKYGRKFQRELTKYNDFLQDTKCVGLGSVQLGDGVDLCFDMLLDGFDFTSVLTLSSLHDAETELNDLREKVSEVKGRLDERYVQADSAVAAYVLKVRDACR